MKDYYFNEESDMDKFHDDMSTNSDLDKAHDECGVFGIYLNNTDNSNPDKPHIDVATYCHTALCALQHRGQDSCGIVINDGGVFEYHKGLGLVAENFKQRTLDRLRGGKIGIGHVRYSPKGQNVPHNVQPMVARHLKGPMAIEFNGSLVNSQELREKYELEGKIFRSTGDVEIFAYAITEFRLKYPSIQLALEQAMHKLKGAYSLVIMSARKLIAARDPHGLRPLCIGKIGDAAWVVASESCALNSIGAEFVRDVRPGEIIVVKDNELTSIDTHCTENTGYKSSMCVFEYIYIARPDSMVEGVSVHSARVRAGELLASEEKVDADIVIGVPDSGIDAALGYSRRSGIEYGIGLIRNRYSERTFIQPTQNERINAVRIKLSPLSASVKGKRVVLVDDSIVRGTTTGVITELLREAGATEVHVRISAPPFIYPCHFGIDIPDRECLVACQMTHEEIKASINADSLGFLSLENVARIVPDVKCGLCDGCFSGKYPMDVPEQLQRDNKYSNKL